MMDVGGDVAGAGVGVKLDEGDWEGGNEGFEEDDGLDDCEGEMVGDEGDEVSVGFETLKFVVACPMIGAIDEG